MKRKIFHSILIIIFFISLTIIPIEKKVGAFTNQTIQQGAVGDDVIELQSRLQYLGFYNGKIDGVFGWGTYWALRNFQYEFSLPIDGLAGPKTKAKLAKASQYNEKYVKDQIRKGNKFTHYGGTDLNKQSKPAPAPSGNNKTPTQNNPAPSRTPAQNNKKPAPAPTPTHPTAANVPNGFSQNDIRLMANAVHGEARGEPYIGQVAIAAVILNRVESASFPNTISGVIFEPRAFTAVSDGQIWLTPDENSKKAVLDALNGWDPTGNAIYYFNPATATSSWIWGRPQIKKIGNHIFCK